MVIFIQDVKARQAGVTFESPSLQMLLIVGLPGSGKSHWARTHMKQHPEKQYRLLGAEELLTCMMVCRTSCHHSQVLSYINEIH